LRSGPRALVPPQLRSPYLRRLGARPLAQWVVGVRAAEPPTGVEPLAWVWYTALPVASSAAAQEVVGS